MRPLMVSTFSVVVAAKVFPPVPKNLPIVPGLVVWNVTVWSPVVQIFDAQHPGRTRIVPELPIDASAGCPTEH
jgi:hypothetical protein